MTAAGIQAGLRHPDAGPRLTALAELIPPEVDATPFAADVGGCVEHPSEQVRNAAIVVLGRIGEPAVPHLMRAMAETQPAIVRTFAAQALAGIGPPALPALRELCRAMTSPDDTLRLMASLALSKTGPPAVPFARRMLGFSDPLVVTAAVDALGW